MNTMLAMKTETHSLSYGFCFPWQRDNIKFYQRNQIKVYLTDKNLLSKISCSKMKNIHKAYSYLSSLKIMQM